MIQRTLLAVTLMLAAFSGTAGVINKGAWVPADCGVEPEPPVLDQTTYETYNQSIALINEWQQKANTYNACLINEANADNALIAKTANEQQSRFKATVEKINKETAAAKALLEGTNTTEGSTTTEGATTTEDTTTTSE